MTMHPAETLVQPHPRERRPQKYMGFALVPGDEDRIATLPDHQQRILLSKGSYKELAETLGIAIGTVRSRLHRARAALTALRRDGVECPDSNPPH